MPLVSHAQLQRQPDRLPPFFPLPNHGCTQKASPYERKLAEKMLPGFLIFFVKHKWAPRYMVIKGCFDTIADPTAVLPPGGIRGLPTWCC